MYVLHLRRALWVAALFAIAGCAGTTPGSLSAGSQGSLPATRHAAVGRGVIRPNYATDKSLVFESDQVNVAVDIYQTKALKSNPAPIAQIKVSAGCPYGVVADTKGTIYVADQCGGNDIEEYPKGSTTESQAITNGISNPLGLAMDKSGTLYVSNYPPSITEYAYGTTSPSKTITGGGLKDPFGLAVDKSGNLFIADFGALQVFELPAGGSGVTALDLQGLQEPIGVAVDQSNGDLWVTDGNGAKVNVYAAGSTTPKESITGFTLPYTISLENKGRPKGTVVIADLVKNAVYAYRKGQYTSYATLTNGISYPSGLLITNP